MSPSDTPVAGAAASGPEVLRDDVVRRLGDRIAHEQADGRLPSLVVGLVRDGALVWWDSSGSAGLPGGGPATAGTQYRIGSISKTFAAVATMRLRDEGVVALGDAVGEHLPELAELPITVAHLLSHTSGLRAETPGPWWERTPGVRFDALVASAIRPVDLLWRPGRRFHYSNVGYAILGELVARKRSAPFGEVVRDELLVPLAMERTTLRPEAPFAEGLAVHPHADAVLREPEHDAVAMAPAGQLWSTIEDLARWSEVLAGRCPEILSAESVAEMAEPIGIVEVPGEAWIAAYGLGLQLWNRGGRRRYGHTGGMPGHWAMLLVDAETTDVVVALANSTYSGFRPAFFDELLSFLGSEQPRPPAPFRPNAISADRSRRELVGAWYFGPAEYRIALDADGHLELRRYPAGRDGRFRPEADGTYVGESGYFAGERLEPRRRDDGSVSHLDIASFVFTRSPYEPADEIPGGIDEMGWFAD